MNARPNCRRGVVLIMALLMLGFLAIVFGVLVKGAISERRKARLEERRIQAAWLAESGLDRAWAKLGESRDYRGETWEIPAETFGGRDSASVQITVARLGTEPGRFRVTSRADYPREGSTRVRQTRTLTLFNMQTSISSGGE